MSCVETSTPAPSEYPWNDMAPGLRAAAEPIRQWLEDPDVLEIMCNRPGEIFVEKLGAEQMLRFEIPALTREAIEKLAHRVAHHSSQHVNNETPLLSSDMPNGERFQAVLWPAAPRGGAFTIRKQVIREMRLEEYLDRGGFDNVKITGPHHVIAETITPQDREFIAILKGDRPRDRLEAVRYAFNQGITNIISGGTSSGKTTLFNAAMKEIPQWERFVTMEDTPELRPWQPNWVQLIASKGDQGRAKVQMPQLLETAMRLRPDRLFMGEVRGAEAFTYLQALNTGHSGSSGTTHANNPWGAYERLAMAALMANMNMPKADLIEFARSVIPLVFQINRSPAGRRGMTEIYFSKWEMAA
ncbi:P-type DNA transfer ATPase VirB11 [Labrys miyagiensis]|nr:P-type DNA transfer ATPase VirB11 [Labrys miyagiensis]